jgi:acyl-CoA synthetase (AMP-forming)/AMP-acid ligase II
LSAVATIGFGPLWRIAHQWAKLAVRYDPPAPMVHQQCRHRSGTAIRVGLLRVVELTESDVLTYCRQHLTAYAMPRVVEFRSRSLPKTNIGQVLRRALREDNAAATAKIVSPKVGSA